MQNLKVLWIAYLTVMQAACVIRDPHEKHRMLERANARLEAYFIALEDFASADTGWQRF